MDEQSNCNYEIVVGNRRYDCNRPIVGKDNKCIFHSVDENKDLLQFRQALLEKTNGDFTGFVFYEQVTDDMFSPAIMLNTDEILDKSSEINLRGVIDDSTFCGIKDGSSNFKTFTKELIFREAVFRKGCVLTNINFSQQVDMSNCKLYDKCYFNESHFIGKLIIDRIKIYGEVDFSGTSFHEAGLSYAGNKEEGEDEEQCSVLFRNVCTAKPEKMIFQQNANLQHWSFRGTDVGKFVFGICKWADSRSVKPVGRANSKILCDEQAQEWCYIPIFYLCGTRNRLKYDDNKIKVMMEVLALYRGLRMAYENSLRYNEAGDFHIGEMEIRRLLYWFAEKRKFYKILPEYLITCLYKRISYYGESYILPLLWFLVLIIAFAFFYMYSGISPQCGARIKYCSSGMPDMEAVYDLIKSFFHSLSVAILFLKDKNYSCLNDFCRCMSVLEAVLGAVILPLFLLAAGRNFKRWRADS